MRVGLREVRPGWQSIQRAAPLRHGPSGRRADTNNGCWPGRLRSCAAPRESTKRCGHFRIAGRGYGRRPNRWPEPVQLLGASHRSVNSWPLFYCLTGAAASLATSFHDSYSGRMSVAWTTSSATAFRSVGARGLRIILNGFLATDGHRWTQMKQSKYSLRIETRSLVMFAFGE